MWTWSRALLLRDRVVGIWNRRIPRNAPNNRARAGEPGAPGADPARGVAARLRDWPLGRVPIVRRFVVCARTRPSQPRRNPACHHGDRRPIYAYRPPGAQRTGTRGIGGAIGAADVATDFLCRNLSGGNAARSLAGNSPISADELCGGCAADRIHRWVRCKVDARPRDFGRVGRGGICWRCRAVGTQAHMVADHGASAAGGVSERAWGVWRWR